MKLYWKNILESNIRRLVKFFIEEYVSVRYEHETELLREQLRQREQDRERQKRSWEMAERAAEERREAERQQLLRQEEELSARMRHQDDELRRRQQENTLFVQV